MDLPKYIKSNKTGRKGLNILTRIIESEFGWIVRPNHQEDDFGIDAFLDVIIDGFVTGKSIAVQIKSGNSYLQEIDDDYWQFIGKKKHLNYYLNHDIPVLIILVDEQKEVAYWEICKIEYVNLQTTQWTMPIPKNQQLLFNQKEKLLKHVPSTVDYVSQLSEYWKDNRLLSDSGRLCIFAGKDDIAVKNYQPLIDLISRICSNKHHLTKFRESIEIGIHGFDNDTRELFHIPEAQEWIADIFTNVPGLSYFIANDEDSQFLKLFLFSTISLINIDSGVENGKILVEYESHELKHVFEVLFGDLNDFTTAFEIPVEINKQITRNIARCITGQDFTR